MSALVTYESSSEDEEAQSIQPGQQTSKEQTSISVANGTVARPSPDLQSMTADNSSEVKQGPMVGPQVQSADNEAYEGYEEEESGTQNPPMSERDTIRYLTQPTHPMTSLPPSPPGSPDANATTRIKRFLDLKSKGVHFNADLTSKSTFQNPSLLTTLMSRAELEGQVQYHNTLSVAAYDTSVLPAWAYKEELLKSQQKLREQKEAARRELSAQGKRTIEFTMSEGGGESRGSTPGLVHKRRRP